MPITDEQYDEILSQNFTDITFNEFQTKVLPCVLLNEPRGWLRSAKSLKSQFRVFSDKTGEVLFETPPYQLPAQFKQDKNWSLNTVLQSIEMRRSINPVAADDEILRAISSLYDADASKDWVLQWKHIVEMCAVVGTEPNPNTQPSSTPMTSAIVEDYDEDF